MEEALRKSFEQIAAIHWSLMLGAIAVLLGVLGKSANSLVDQAVILADRSGIPKVVIGATLVSLGTTTPEAAVSVFAAIQGDPGLALGNAVGSIICDTGLILGIACLIAPLPLDRRIVNKQGWVQVAAGILLVAASYGFERHLPQHLGLFFLGLLGIYLWQSARWGKAAARKGAEPEDGSTQQHIAQERNSLAAAVRLGIAVSFVVLSSHVLIPAVQVAAELLGIPEDIIAASLVAFGTSLPELVTGVTSSWRGHGEIAVGNVIGADILNVLFVAGAACAVTPDGLTVPDNFFRLHFPAMLVILAVFRIGVAASHDRLHRGFGALLVAVYGAYLVAQYVI